MCLNKIHDYLLKYSPDVNIADIKAFTETEWKANPYSEMWGQNWAVPLFGMR